MSRSGVIGDSGVTVLCRGVVEPFFSCAAAPHIHPFVNPSADIRRPSRPRGLTPSILVRPSRERKPPQSGQRRRNPSVHWAVRLALRRKGLFFSRRRADASVSPLILHFLCYIFLLGKTESGYAGEQPGEG